MQIEQMIESVDELLRLRHESLKLLQELRRRFVLAQRFGVHPDEIVKDGFDPTLDFRRRFGYLCLRVDFDNDLWEPNYVILKDGRRIEQYETWEDATKRQDYVAWRKAELAKWDGLDGPYLFRPDVSPAAWKRAMKKIADEKEVNRIDSPATEIPNQGAAG